MNHLNFKFLMVLLALFLAIPPAWADETLTVCDGTTTNVYVPYCSELANSNSSNFTSQMIYLPTNLSELPSGATIKSITFYGYTSIPSKIYDRRFRVYMGETDLTAVTETTLNNRSLVTNQVFGGDYGTTPDYSGTALTFTFTNGYTWNGGNLAIELYCASSSNSSDQSFYWYGVSANSGSSGFHRLKSSSNYNYLQSFLPKMTITYEGGSAATPELTVDNTLSITDTDGDTKSGTVNMTAANLTDNLTITSSTNWSATANSDNTELTIEYTGKALHQTGAVTLSSSADNLSASVATDYLYTGPIYIIGNASSWDPSSGVQMTANNGIYTAQVTAQDCENGYSYIGFTKRLGSSSSDWSINDYRFGPVSTDDNWALYNDYVDLRGVTCALDTNGNYKTIQMPAGATYIITVTPADNTFMIEEYVEPVATPVISPEGGDYTEAQTVTITCATDGATIYYTTDGTDPTTSSTQYTGSFTVSETTTVKAIAVKEGMSNSEIASATYTLPEAYAVTVSPDGGTIDFGSVVYTSNGTATRTITITNTGTNAITPSLSALTAPFSTDYTATELASGNSLTITITFTPTAEGTFSDNATLSFGNGLSDRTFSLTGTGSEYNENDHSAIYNYDYTWTDDSGVEHTSSLLETATDPNQMIAMLREIYTNKNIPGNKKRGYTEAGDVESLTVNGHDAFTVNYSAVGQLTKDSNYDIVYEDTYGWNIPTNNSVLSMTKGSNTYYYMDPTEYEPEEEGLTVVMIEMKDGANPSGDSDYYSFSSSLTLKEKFEDNFKSVRLLTEYKTSGSGEGAGTLFKIDADKLNRFFFLGKGQLRLVDHSQSYEQTWTSSNVVPYPSLKGSTFTDNTFNSSSGGDVLAPFVHMFEEFSPNVANSSSSAMTDVYQDLVNMESYEVVHDCVSVPFVGGNHEFNMYGVNSTSDDCQDVRDMMFFVPEYRMKYWKAYEYAIGDSVRDPNSMDKFVNYNKYHRPTLGLYVIRQNEITGEKQANANVYDLNLSWESNLLDFLPDAEGMYELYRVEVDADGNKTYVHVATLDANVTTYVDQVAMQETGQQVTYVVQGQDKTQFLSLQMSNEESYIIPGLNKKEIFILSANTDDYARFNPLEERNYYANELTIKNSVGTCITGDYMGSGAKFTFYRYEGYNYTDTVKVFEAVSDGNGTLTITPYNQRESGLYNEWINMVNPSTVTYTVGSDNNYVTFNDFTLYDNFYASVANNNHPSLYIYSVYFEAPTGVTIANTDGNTAHSNQIATFVHKTDMDVVGYTKDEIDADTNHSLTVGLRKINELVKYSSKTEILRYDAYRWKQMVDKYGYIIDFDNSERNTTTGGITTESDMAPTGLAGNQASYYTVKMDGLNSDGITIGQGQALNVTYMDYVVEDEAGMYTYAPVVETFTSRDDYNTYGAPLQQTGVATFTSAVIENGYYPMISANTWTEDSKTYAHYTVLLDINSLLIPDSANNALKDYDLYKVRVWRQVDTSLLNEQDYNSNDGRNRDARVTGDFLMEEVNYDTYNRTTVANATGNRYYLGNNDNLTDFHSTWTTAGTNEVMATFGAQKVGTGAGEITSLPMTFIVRAYYTRTANLNTTSTFNGVDKALDGKYYIAEYTLPYTLTSTNIVTAVNGVYANRQVTGVTYYNMMGQASPEPFSGVNIVVTNYSDGTTSTSKVLK